MAANRSDEVILATLDVLALFSGTMTPAQQKFKVFILIELRVGNNSGNLSIFGNFDEVKQLDGTEY